MKPAYSVVSKALNLYRDFYRDAIESKQPFEDNRTVADFILEAGYDTYAPPAVTSAAMQTVNVFASVLDPDIDVVDAIAALKKAKRALR